MALLERNSKSTLYKGLSSFWHRYFRDSEQLHSIYAATESLLGQAYLDLMEVVLSKSLTNIPVFKREDWKLLILQQDQVSFDPPVVPAHYFQAGQAEFAVVADAIDVNLNDVAVSFVDIAHVRETDVEFFPTVGVFNHALTGKSVSTKHWTVVVPSNETIKESLIRVKSRLVSNKEITAVDVGSDVEFTISYGEGEADIAVVLTAAEQSGLSTPEELATLLDTKINKAEITTSIQAGYLIIESTGESLRVTSNNTACEDLLFITKFNFVIGVDVPYDLQDILLWEYTYYIQLITAGYKEEGTEYRYLIGTTAQDKQIRHTQYLMNTIYEPSVVLEEAKDYRISDGYIYFTEDPFALGNLAFRVIDDSKQLAFWMSDVLYDNTLLYDRYGYRFTDPREASEDYKLFLRGIIFYYTNGPNIDNITSALNLVAGIPVVLENGEIVQDIQVGLIVTDKHSYEVPTTANPVVSLGQELQAFDVLTDAFVVEDYIISPDWFKNLSVPSSLMPGATLEQRKLRESVDVPAVGDPTYIVGDTNPAAETLTTDTIYPYGPVGFEYQLIQDAYFEVEIGSEGLNIPVLIPKEYTIGATTLTEIAEVITNSVNQVSGIPFTGTDLDYDATFDVNGETVTVPASTYGSINTIISIINSQLIAPMEVRLTPDEETLLFLSSDGASISITDVSTTAQMVLGLQGFRSFLGIVATADGDQLIFSNVSEESESLMRIVNISGYTMTVWAMQPFRSGSGHIVGEDGQPNLTYDIFDKILKYSTFKVTFNIADVSAETDLGAIIDIVLKGKPKYVTPIVSPILDFDDTLENNETVVPYGDAEGFVPADPSIAEQYDVSTLQEVDIVFSTEENVRVHYDFDFEVPDFIVLEEPGVNFWFNSNESNLRFDSKDGRVFGRINHEITIGVQNNLTVEDELLYSFPGVYNHGIQTTGEPYPLTTVVRAGVGTHSVGIYEADVDWVNGPYKAELDPRVTHMFLMGETRPAMLSELGFGEGDFLELKFWPDADNNGKFSILNVSYNVLTPHGYADIIWYENENAVADNIPAGKDEFDGSSYSFHYKSGNIGKKWFVTVPENKLMSEILVELDSAVGDNRDSFPFDISLIGPDANWDTTSYVTEYTSQDPEEERSFMGERYQVSAEWPRCFFIGDTYHDEILAVDLPYLINPLDRIICEGVPREESHIIGFGEDNEIGDDIIIGTTDLYNGGELSTVEALQITQGDFVASPIPGYQEYTP